MAVKARKNLFVIAALLAAVLFCSGCGFTNQFFGTTNTTGSTEGSPTPPSSASPATADDIRRMREEFDQYVEDIFIEAITDDTLSLHQYLEYPERMGIEPQEPAFPSYSGGDEIDADEDYQKYLDELCSFDRSLLTKEQQLTYDVFKYTLDLSKDGEQYRLYSEPLSTQSGEQTMLPVVLAEYRFMRVEDVDTYLALMEDLPNYISSILSFEKEKSEAGFFMTSSAADDVIKSCRSLAEITDDHLLIESFDSKLSAVEGLSEDQKDEYRKKNESLVRDIFAPQYLALADGIEQLKDTCRDDGGLATLKGGAKYMTHLCRSVTGTGYTPEEIISLLNDEVQSSLRKLYMMISMDDSLLQAMEDFHFDAETPEEILDDLIKKSEADFPAPSAVDYSVSYVPESMEPYTGQAFYLLPPIDVDVKNHIYVNQSQISDNTELYPVMAHEGYPGHMLQQLYCTENGVSPLRMLYANLGYQEGWAQYVSSMSYAFNTEAKNNVTEALRLNDVINYDFSALCDLYVNYMGYSRSKLARYMSDMGLDAENVDELYDTLMNNPGIYLPYAVGTLEMFRLRSYAEAELGFDFSALEFHRAILNIGPAPFEIVEREIEEWIVESRLKTA